MGGRRGRGLYGSNFGRAAGGGGAFAETDAIAVTPGDTFTVTVGAGGAGGTSGSSSGSDGDSSSFSNGSVDVSAAGGSGGSSNTVGGPGGSAASSIGQIRFDGGNGGDGYSTADCGGAGGGASGNPLAAGADGTSVTNATCDGHGKSGGVGANGGGSGGHGGDYFTSGGDNGTNGSSPGGGGGGLGAFANFAGYSAKHGSAGEVLISWFSGPTVPLRSPERAGGKNPSVPGIFNCAQGCGDPVNTATGDFSETSTDASVSTYGPPLDFTRTYDASLAQAQVATGTPGALGYGWSDNWGDSLTFPGAAPGDIYTVAGKGTALASSAPASSVGLSGPSGVAVDSSGDIYIADTGDNRIEEIAGSSGTQWGIAMTAGDAYTVAGSASGESGSSGDGGPTGSALLFSPEGLVVDSAGDVYFADAGEQRDPRNGSLDRDAVGPVDDRRRHLHDRWEQFGKLGRYRRWRSGDLGAVGIPWRDRL